MSCPKRVLYPELLDCQSRDDLYLIPDLIYPSIEEKSCVREREIESKSERTRERENEREREREREGGKEVFLGGMIKKNGYFLLFFKSPILFIYTFI